ncbi:hypothetical protein C2G38_2050186 [Gigaspora rosea]|uniref:Uncharacterized protein n=1 Tax=Gigaspora rosea TaxID=44941 RepID=A0A397TWM6_9GLOM|nr:hypothetical protein C2G38_2050186 [Gigaspora rosea]
MAPFDESELNASQKFQSDFQVGRSKSLNFYPSDLKREIKTKNNKVMSFIDIANSAVKNNTIINTIKDKVEEINQMYVNSECNKETIRIMKNRAKNAKSVIEEFIRNDEIFKQKEYRVTLLRLEDVLTKIKEYCEKVSKFGSYKQFFNANEIKNKYNQLTEEYETCIR